MNRIGLDRRKIRRELGLDGSNGAARFFIPNSLLLIDEEVGSFMLIKLFYKAILIKKMQQRQDRLMLQSGEHRVAI